MNLGRGQGAEQAGDEVQSSKLKAQGKPKAPNSTGRNACVWNLAFELCVSLEFWVLSF
jgi:hypothetical protein